MTRHEEQFLIELEALARIFLKFLIENCDTKVINRYIRIQVGIIYMYWAEYLSILWYGMKAK